MADILERLDCIEVAGRQEAIQAGRDAAAEIRRLRAAVAGYGRDPESCTTDGPCVSHMAYLEAEAELDKLRFLVARKSAALSVVADPAMWDALDLPEGCTSYEWQGIGSFADPRAWAKIEADATEASG